MTAEAPETLVITEKNSQARHVSDAIFDSPEEQTHNGHTYWAEGDIAVVPMRGHIYELKNKESRNGYPDFPELKHIPKDDTENIHDLLTLMTIQAEEIVVATDNDREGTLIGVLGVLIPMYGSADPENLEKAQNSTNLTRMRYSAMVEDEILDAWDNRAEVDNDLYISGLARQRVDYRVGINYSKAITQCLLRGIGEYNQLSAGRVQTPTLSIVQDRCQERREFEPDDFWTPTFQTGDAVWVGEDIYDEDEMSEIERKLENNDKVEIKGIEDSTWHDNPPVPLNLPFAQKSFSGSPSQVLNNIQSLYEKGHVTYPRTENTQYSDDFDINGLVSILDSYSPIDVPVEPPWDPTSGDKFDPAHPPITPTGNVPNFGDLGKWEKLTYIRIVKHFVATLMDSAIKKKREFVVEVDGVEFRTDVRTMVRMGYLETYGAYSTVYNDKERDWEEGDVLDIDGYEIEEKETEPPDRYTQSSIISEMENLGLGTSATRGNIVNKLFYRRYVGEGSSLETTRLGDTVVEVLEDYAPKITDPEYTSELQDLLDKLAEGKTEFDEVMSWTRQWVSNVCFKIKKNEEDIGQELRSAFVRENACEECGGTLYLRETGNGNRLWGCENYKGDEDGSCKYIEDVGVSS